MISPKCPVCGCEAVDSSQQKTLPIQQFVTENIVCHCLASHRFVVSWQEHCPAATERHNSQRSYASSAVPIA
jgi:hypothetical protein